MSNYTYMVTNNKNGKVYVGSHSWKGEGLDPNYYGSGIAITAAVKKYGKKNFQVEVLYYYDTVEECRKDEERILTEYNVRDCPHSYNIKNGAVGWTSEDMKGKNNTMYGKHHTDKTRQKIARANKGLKRSEEFKRKLSRANIGKALSDETRQKIARANKGKTLSDEHRKNLSQAMKRKTASKEYRQKLSRAHNYEKTPIVAIQKDTGKIRVFESIIGCARQLNLDQSHIHQCLKGKCKTCKGYIIKHLKRCSTDYKITKRKAKKTEKIKLTIKRKGSTPLVAIQKDTGRVRMFLSQAECIRELTLRDNCVSACLKGKRKSTGGYVIKKINRDKRVFTVSQRSKADINR